MTEEYLSRARYLTCMLTTSGKGRDGRLGLCLLQKSPIGHAREAKVESVSHVTLLGFKTFEAYEVNGSYEITDEITSNHVQVYCFEASCLFMECVREYFQRWQPTIHEDQEHQELAKLQMR